MAESIYVVAEPGGTAEGCLDGMLEAIEVARAAGCQAVKVQWVSDPAKLARQRRAPEYEAAYRHLAWPVEWHEDLAQACRVAGLHYGCSVYLIEDVPRVLACLDFFKVSSFEASSRPLRQAICRVRRPVMVSFGMHRAAPRYEGRVPPLVLSARRWVREHAFARLAQPGTMVSTSARDMTCLVATSAYPTPLDALGLSRLWQLRSGLGDWHGDNVKLGYSDHGAWASGLRSGAWATAAGAEVLEVHTRLDNTPPENADYATALTPAALTEYVARVREIEPALGVERLEAVEAPMRQYQVRR